MFVEIDGRQAGGVFVRPGLPDEAITLEAQESKAHTSATLLGSSWTTPGHRALRVQTPVASLSCATFTIRDLEEYDRFANQSSTE